MRIFLIVVSFSFALITIAFAQDTPPDSGEVVQEEVSRDSVMYSADTIEYMGDENLIILDGNAVIVYQDAKLKADHIKYNIKTRDLIAWGVPVLWDGGDKIVGNRLFYNMDTQQGTIFKGFTQFEAGFYHGARIKKVGKSTINVVEGKYTTCDAEHPHYHFSSERMRIYAKDKVIAKPVVLKFGAVPVFLLPYAIFPIKRGRHSGLLTPRFGERGFLYADTERYVENIGYYLALNDYSDMTVAFDYGEKRGWWWRWDGRYRTRYSLRGSADFEYRTQPTSTGRRKDWKLRWNHSHTIDENLSLVANVNLSSGKTFYEDSRDFDEQLTRQINSRIRLTQRWTFGTAYVAASETRTFNYIDDEEKETRVRVLPELRFSMRYPTIPLFPFGPEDAFYRDIEIRPSSNLSTRNQKRTGTETETTIDVSHSVGLSKSIQLSAIQLTPSVSYSERWDNDEDPHKDINLSGGVRANTTIFGIFKPGILGIQMLRHTIRPSASFTYRPDRKIEADGMILPFMNWDYQYTPIRPTKSMSMSMNHVFEMKVSQSKQLTEKTENDTLLMDAVMDSVGKDSLMVSSDLRSETARSERKIQLATLNLATSYDFAKDENQWSNLSSTLRTNPLEFFQVQMGRTRVQTFSLDWTTVHGMKTGGLQSVSFNANLGVGGQFKASRNETTISKSRWTLFDVDTLEIYEDRNVASDIYFGERSNTLGTKRSWSLRLGYGYRSSSYGSPKSDMSIRLQLQPTANWRVTYATRYDFEDKELTRQSFNITRDLHCWEAVIRWDRLGDRWNYNFVFRIKELPDLKIEQFEQGDR